MWTSQSRLRSESSRRSGLFSTRPSTTSAPTTSTPPAASSAPANRRDRRSPRLARLDALMVSRAPAIVGVLGLTAYRRSFGKPKVLLGEQGTPSPGPRTTRARSSASHRVPPEFHLTDWYHKQVPRRAWGGPHVH
ncbi:exported hypothetical protein [Micrococcus sp. 116]|nr:exported hypothetical protein [Micrococcus sp. 116]